MGGAIWTIARSSKPFEQIPEGLADLLARFRVDLRVMCVLTEELPVTACRVAARARCQRSDGHPDQSCAVSETKRSGMLKIQWFRSGTM